MQLENRKTYSIVTFLSASEYKEVIVADNRNAWWFRTKREDSTLCANCTNKKAVLLIILY